MTEEEREIASLHEAWMQEIVTNEVTKIAAYMADDWVLVTPEAGPIAKQHFLDAIARGDLSHDDMHAAGETRVRRYGNSAVLIIRVENHGWFQGQPFTYDEWTTNTYVKTDGSWLCVATALTHVRPS